MKIHVTWPELFQAAIGNIVVNPLPVALRAIPWFFTLITMPWWIWLPLGFGVVVGPVLFDAVDAPKEAYFGFDGLLLVVACGGLRELTSSWIAAILVTFVYAGWLVTKGWLFKAPEPTQKLTLLKPDKTVDPAIFVRKVIEVTWNTLAKHGWHQATLVGETIELKRFQYRALTTPDGALTITCFDDAFPGTANYRLPLIGLVDLSLHLPEASVATIDAIFTDICADMQAGYPGSHCQPDD